MTQTCWIVAAALCGALAASASGARHRRADGRGRPVRRPHGDGADARSRGLGVLHWNGVVAAHRADRRPLPAVGGEHAGAFSRRDRRAGRHGRRGGGGRAWLSAGCGGQAHALARRRARRNEAAAARPLPRRDAGRRPASAARRFRGRRRLRPFSRAQAGDRRRAARRQARGPGAAFGGVALARGGAEKKEAPASGDSGGPIFAPDGSVVAIAAWTEGASGAKCGVLTQGVLVAPSATGSPRRSRAGGTERERGALQAPPAALAAFAAGLRLGRRFGQVTIRFGQSSIGRSSSLANTRPRTDTPASCTLSGEPETSGCQGREVAAFGEAPDRRR